jgi:FkbM family methyltransferase
MDDELVEPSDTTPVSTSEASSPSPIFDELDLLDSLTTDIPSGLFIDVGAHIGRFSERFARRGWSVVAFEPAPAIAERLQAALEPFASQVVIQAAVSDADVDEVEFHISTEHWGIHSLQPFHESHTETVTVPMVRLDTSLFSMDLDQVVILKIDAEGADFPALKSWNFDQARPLVVVCEFMDSRSEPAFGYGYKDVVEYMAGYGYSAYISEWTPIVEYSREGITSEGPSHIGVFSADTVHDPSWGNLVFVPEDHRPWFEKRLVRYLAGVARAAGGVVATAESDHRQFHNMTRTLENREQRISELEFSLNGQKSRITELATAIDQRDSRITELATAIDQRDSRIAELDAAIVQRDARIAELDAAIVQRDARIAELHAKDSHQRSP